MSTPDPADESPPYHHGDLRRALLTAAADLLEEQDPRAFSLREVARRAGVSHSAPYRHFPHRDALLDAIAADGFRALTARMGAIRAASPTDRLAALGQAYVAAALERPGRFVLMFSVTSTPRDYPETAAAAPALMVVLREAVASVTGDPTDGVAAASAWAVVHGLAHLFLQGHLRGSGGNTVTDTISLTAEVTRRHAASLGAPSRTGGRRG